MRLWMTDGGGTQCVQYTAPFGRFLFSWLTAVSEGTASVSQKVEGFYVALWPREEGGW